MNALYYFNLGTQYFEAKQYVDAISMFHQALALDGHYETYEMLYHCYEIMGDYPRAFSYILKAYTLNGGNDKTARLYAEGLLKTGKEEEAKEVLLEIVQRNQSYLPAWRLLNRICQV